MLTRIRMGRTRSEPKISTPDYIGTGDCHNPTSSQSHRPIISLPSRPNGNYTVKLRVRVILAGRFESINNGTDMTLVACGAIRYANWGLNERTGEMLIKNFVGAQLPFPFYSLSSPSPFCSSFISTSSSGHC